MHEKNNHNLHHGIALAKVCDYIEEVDMEKENPHFKMQDLAKMYEAFLKQLNIDVPSKTHSTRLKEKILAYLPDLEAVHKGREIILMYRKDIDFVVCKMVEETYDDEGKHLMKTSKIVCKEVLKNNDTFNGKFTKDCQNGSVPSSLLMLVQSLLYGNQSSDASYSQEVLTIALLIQFNTTDSKNSRHYHLKNNEPPLPVYIGILIYSRTRRRDSIDIL